MGKQPEEQLHPRGFLGLELAEARGRSVRVGRRPGRLARGRAGVRAGDRLVRVRDRDGRRASRPPATPSPRSGPATASPLVVRRGDGGRGPRADLTVTAGEGL